MNCSLPACNSELNFCIALASPALNWFIALSCAELNWLSWDCIVLLNWSTCIWLEALNCSFALAAAVSLKIVLAIVWALNISVCCSLLRLAISICKKFLAFSTWACCKLLKPCVSSWDNCAASAITNACLLLRFCRSTVCAILAFSNATCWSALKFMLAISLTLDAFITLAWKAWSKSCCKNLALCSALAKAICCLLAVSICAIGSAASIAACITAWPAILDAPKPLEAISMFALRIAPAAQGGVLPPSNWPIKVVSSSCTDAAFTSPVPNASPTLVWSTALPDTVSPASSLRSSISATVWAWSIWAASKSETAVSVFVWPTTSLVGPVEVAACTPWPKVSGNFSFKSSPKPTDTNPSGTPKPPVLTVTSSPVVGLKYLWAACVTIASGGGGVKPASSALFWTGSLIPSSAAVTAVCAFWRSAVVALASEGLSAVAAVDTCAALVTIGAVPNAWPVVADNTVPDASGLILATGAAATVPAGFNTALAVRSACPWATCSFVNCCPPTLTVGFLSSVDTVGGT